MAWEEKPRAGRPTGRQLRELGVGGGLLKAWAGRKKKRGKEKAKTGRENQERWETERIGLARTDRLGMGPGLPPKKEVSQRQWRLEPEQWGDGLTEKQRSSLTSDCV